MQQLYTSFTSWVNRQNNREAKHNSAAFLNRTFINFEDINSDFCGKIHTEVKFTFCNILLPLLLWIFKSGLQYSSNYISVFYINETEQNNIDTLKHTYPGISQDAY